MIAGTSTEPARGAAEPGTAAPCRPGVKIVVAGSVLALVLASAASAKVKLWLTLGDRTPAVGQPVAVVLHSEVRLGFNLKLIAVAPGKDWFDVVGKITGDASRPKATIPRDGFAIPVVRLAGNRWRAVVRFPRPGRWRLVIPNEAPEGIMLPPPVMVPVTVRWAVRVSRRSGGTIPRRRGGADAGVRSRRGRAGQRRGSRGR